MSFKRVELLGFVWFGVFSSVSSKGLDTIMVFLIVYSVQYHLKHHKGKSLRSYSFGFLGMQSDAAFGSTKALMPFFWDKRIAFAHPAQATAIWDKPPPSLSTLPVQPKGGGSLPASGDIFTQIKNTPKSVSKFCCSNEKCQKDFYTLTWRNDIEKAMLVSVTATKLQVLTLLLGQVTEIERIGRWDYCSSGCQQQFNKVYLNYNLTHTIQMNQKKSCGSKVDWLTKSA